MPSTRWPANWDGSRRRSPTKHLLLLGADRAAALRKPGSAARLGVTDEVLTHLVNRYGSEARTVIAMMEADPQLGRPLLDGLPYLRAEAVYAARYEMAWTLDDVLSRRTRALAAGPGRLGRSRRRRGPPHRARARMVAQPGPTRRSRPTGTWPVGPRRP